MAKLALLAMGILTVLCVCSKPTKAQGSDPCTGVFAANAYSLRNLEWVPPIPSTATDCRGIGYQEEVQCQVKNTACPPPPDCGCGGGGGGPAGGGGGGGPDPRGGSAGGPIFLTNGDTFITESDVKLPGLGGGLTLTRNWNSILPADMLPYSIGMFGPGWRSTYEERVFVGSDGYLKYLRADGSVWSFGYVGYSNGTNTNNYASVSPVNGAVTIRESTTTQGTYVWQLIFQNGESRSFAATGGMLTSISDRNGNATELSYDTNGRLITVTDPAGRQLSFSYESNAGPVTSVTSNFGVSVAYSYDDQGRLTQVTEPDQSTFNFQYDANSKISAVLDSQGKILESHTYDSSGRGLTSSRANGVEAVTISYQ